MHAKIAILLQTMFFPHRFSWLPGGDAGYPHTGCLWMQTTVTRLPGGDAGYPRAGCLWMQDTVSRANGGDAGYPRTGCL
ncbi:hypothetical protein HMPREF1981_01256 [Bacteroides pyogenes F0041]|uniref:Uncharacterized protein n=1 Tax=Bacteroides pyogenes F0041 TaxID=1321819 RepID=U2E0X0_9BACE|nr:hypothetical protein HMPREF1981_01256 [Bacteroides pyogenes F0041]